MPTSIERAWVDSFGNNGGGVFPRISIGQGFWGNAIQVSRNIDYLNKSLKNMKVPLTMSVQEVIIPAIEKNFAVQGRPNPWKSLAPITVYMRGGRTRPILIDTGTMYEAATSESIWRITSTSATITGKITDYAKYHVTGTKVMPKRNFMYISSDERQRVVEIFTSWFLSQARRRGKFK